MSEKIKLGDHEILVETSDELPPGTMVLGDVNAFRRDWAAFKLKAYGLEPGYLPTYITSPGAYVVVRWSVDTEPTAWHVQNRAARIATKGGAR